MAVAVILLVLALVWVGWRLASKRAVLPCPSEIAWLVEMENPLARATRSEQIVEQLDLRRGDRVMDVGCGPGRVTVPLARAVGPEGNVIALDVQEGMLARVASKAKEAGLMNITPMRTDIRTASVPAGSLDAATMVMALGEIPDGADVFSSVFSMLKPGGRLLVAESVFDPHYVARRRVRERAMKAGFREGRCSGNMFGYSVTYERP